jgi:putative ABC transport system permease protein
VREALEEASRRPLHYTAVAITLGAGVGVAAAVSSAALGLLRPPGLSDPDRLVYISAVQPRIGRVGMRISPPNFRDLAGLTDAFSGAAALYDDAFTISGEGEVERVSGALVSESYSQVVGLPMHLGRGPAPGEEGVVVLSHGLWKRRYGGAPELLGRTVRINSAMRVVIGIAAKGAEYPRDAELWIPLDRDRLVRPRSAGFLEVVARLRPGVALAQAQARVDTLAATLATEYPESNTGWVFTLTPLEQQMVGGARPVLHVLVGAALALLLVACANAGALLLARGLEREHEVGVRRALGCSRARVAMHFAGLHLLVSGAATGVGVVIGWVLLRALSSIVPASIVPAQSFELGDAITAGAAVGAITSCLFGVAAVVGTARSEPARALALGGRARAGVGSRRVGQALVVGQLALSFAVLVPAIAVGWDYARLLAIDPGFKTDHMLTFRVSAAGRPRSAAEIVAFYGELTDRLARLPGVESVASADAMPLTGSTEGTECVLPAGNEGASAERVPVAITVVSQGYFRALGVPVNEGREFERTDASPFEEGACVEPVQPPLVVVNASMAKHWPGRSAIGQHIRLGGESGRECEIVGVVGDVRHEGLDAVVAPRVYLFDGQFPGRERTFAVRTEGEPMERAAPVRAALREIDPDLPAYAVRTMDEVLRRSLGLRRASVWLLGTFAAIAMALSGMGVYGLSAMSVNQRSKELGVRLAVGSSRMDLFGLVLRSALKLTAGGGALGAGLAYALYRTQAAALVAGSGGLAGASAAIFAGGVLTTATILGALAPALRASRQDPAMLLRDA